MKLDRALRREYKQNKTKTGMRISNKSIFILEEQKKKRAEKIKREREQKEKLQNAEDET